MPTYQYECKGCGSSWEETHRIAEREKPLKVPCRVCFDEIRLIPQIPSMISMRGSCFISIFAKIYFMSVRCLS